MKFGQCMVMGCVERLMVPGKVVESSMQRRKKVTALKGSEASMIGAGPLAVDLSLFLSRKS
jgi:hypothetical protein